MNTPPEVIPSDRWKNYFPSSKILPKESQKVSVHSDVRGTFTASRHGHDWRVGFLLNDGWEWVGLAIKDNDWWRYVDAPQVMIKPFNKDRIK